MNEHAYEMPAVSVGQIVLYHPVDNVDDPVSAVVVAVGHETVALKLITISDNRLVERSAVRHHDDPRLPQMMALNQQADQQTGCWRHTEQTELIGSLQGSLDRACSAIQRLQEQIEAVEATIA